MLLYAEPHPEGDRIFVAIAMLATMVAPNAHWIRGAPWSAVPPCTSRTRGIADAAATRFRRTTVFASTTWLIVLCFAADHDTLQKVDALRAAVFYRGDGGPRTRP